tara:strand:- start:1360 stop:1569 length:210 start_codon:yes stop_codon:yes gene_type:complete
MKICQPALYDYHDLEFISKLVAKRLADNIDDKLIIKEVKNKVGSTYVKYTMKQIEVQKCSSNQFLKASS